MIQNYGIGGNEIPLEVSESISDIPQNRTLLVEKLTSTPVLKPEIVSGLKTVDEVFDHYKPTQKVEFQTIDGGTVREELSFKNLGDFGEKGIINQSSFLQDTKKKSEEYKNIMKNMKSNAMLRKVINDPEKKEALLNAFKAMISEIQTSTNK